ncbi:MAG: hypothetical protein WCE68_12830 [Anaerolineales bacterium]
MPSLAERLFGRFTRPSGRTATAPTGGKRQQRVVQAKLAEGASPITDANFFPMGLNGVYTSRTRYDRMTILAECLRAWRINPVARRVVDIFTEFMVGEGLAVKSSHNATHKYLQKWWNDDQNAMDEQIPEWMDELTRTGDLFILFSVDEVSGMSYVRPIPAEMIKDIQVSQNDVRQEQFFIPTKLDEEPTPAFDNTFTQTAFIVHYATNRPVGCKFGEPDLAPLLPWVGRYSQWLEDRARLNRYRNAFMYVVRGEFPDKAARDARQNEIAANPPPPGSVLVHDASEDWGILAPQLDSHDANEDGLSIKKMIAIGAGIPIHFLAEPESSTKTTAEAAGTPAFKSLEQNQQAFIRFITKLAKIAVGYRRQAAPQMHLRPDLVSIEGPDITERDNATLAQAIQRSYPAIADIFDRGGVDDAEFLRLVYRMAGESFGEDAQVPKILRKQIQQAQADGGVATEDKGQGTGPSEPGMKLGGADSSDEPSSGESADS